MNPRNPSFKPRYMLGQTPFRALIGLLIIVAALLITVALYLLVDSLAVVSASPQAIATVLFAGLLAVVVALTTRRRGVRHA